MNLMTFWKSWGWSIAWWLVWLAVEQVACRRPFQAFVWKKNYFLTQQKGGLHLLSTQLSSATAFYIGAPDKINHLHSLPSRQMDYTLCCESPSEQQLSHKHMCTWYKQTHLDENWKVWDLVLHTFEVHPVTLPDFSLVFLDLEIHN